MRFSNSILRKIKSYKVSSPKAWALASDSEVLKLDWNESTINPSPKVYNAISDSVINKKWNWYPDINNTKLIQALSKYCGVNQNQVQYFASSDALHEYIVRCFISNNDRILTVTPTYDNFRAVAEANNGNIHSYSLDKNFKLDLSQLKSDLELIKPKIVYLVNPNNPTGTEHDIDQLEELIKNSPDNLFIVDEAYFEFNGKTISYLTSFSDNLIISRTFSKAFGLASFRIGYCIAHESIIETLNKIRNPKNVSLFAQEAALAALEDFRYVSSYVKEVNLSKDVFFSFLQSKNWINPVHGAGNFIFMEIKNNVKRELIIFLESNKVFVRDYGHIEQTKDYMRITIGTMVQMKKVITVINAFESKL
jgi:histidinol-phosphate aminotransferase